MYWQSSGSRASLLVRQNARLLRFGAEGDSKMAEQESAAVRNANKHFRKEEQAQAGAAAWKEYVDQEEATRLKTARLRAQRLARDAAAASDASALPKRSVRTGLAKRTS
jgi:hypothetical protein